MKKIALALLLTVASLNVVACVTHQAVDSSNAEMAEQTSAAQTSSNDALRK